MQGRFFIPVTSPLIYLRGFFFLFIWLDDAQIQILSIIQSSIYDRLFSANISLQASLEDDAYYYFVLEYRGGGDMFSFVKRAGRLPSNPARIYFKQILEGVQYLHKMGVCVFF